MVFFPLLKSTDEPLMNSDPSTPLASWGNELIMKVTRLRLLKTRKQRAEKSELIDPIQRTNSSGDSGEGGYECRLFFRLSSLNANQLISSRTQLARISWDEQLFVTQMNLEGSLATKDKLIAHFFGQNDSPHMGPAFEGNIGPLHFSH